MRFGFCLCGTQAGWRRMLHSLCLLKKPSKAQGLIQIFFLGDAVEVGAAP